LTNTGLDGSYSFSINASHMPGLSAGPLSSHANHAPSVFAAVEEQLGLKLETAQVNVDIVVIDHIEPPEKERNEDVFGHSRLMWCCRRGVGHFHGRSRGDRE
jgi:hypothetical protein